MTRIFRLSNLSTRLISGASFEAWSSGITSAPDGWTATGTPSLSQSESNVIDGLYSCRIQNASTEADRGIYQDITSGIVAGETYYVRVFANVVSGVARVSVYDGGGTSNAVTVDTTATGNQQIIVKKTAPATGGIRIGIFSRTASNGDVYADLVQTGTGFVEFIEGEYDTTFRITNWRESVADYKGGGDFAGSVVGDNSKLVSGYWENAIQTVDFHVKGRVSQDNVGAKLRELMALCYSQANRYGFDSSVLDPVYIEAKYKNETNSRYALVVKATIPEIPDGMGIEFEQLYLLEASLIVNHKQWLSVPPGHGLNLSLGALEVFNSTNFGTVGGTGTFAADKGTRSFWVGNRRSQSNLTHIFNYDDSGTSFSSNLLNGGSFTLFPASPAVNDIVYFGTSTAIANSGPFSSLLFNIQSIASAGTSYGMTWEYWNGGAWAGLTPRDNTVASGAGSDDSFSALGQNVVAWAHPTAWAANTINAVTAYWVRVRLSALTGALTRPVQADTQVQAIMWPYAEINHDQTGGSISSPARLLVTNYSGSGATTGTDYIFAGLRSISRGSNFTSQINISDEQNPTGITITALPGIAFGDDINTATGRSLQYTTVTAAWTEIGYITFASSIALHFYGKFRAFLVVRQVGAGANIFSARIAIGGFFGSSSRLAYSNSAFVPVVDTANTLLDLGEVTLPGTDTVGGRDSSEFNVFLQVNCTTTTRDLYIETLVLVPSDEMFYAGRNVSDAKLGYGAVLSGTNLYLDADNLTNPRRGLRNVIRKTSDDVQADVWGRQSTELFIQPKGTQRLWLFSVLNSSSVLYAPISQVFSVELQTVKRYLSMRGAG